MTRYSFESPDYGSGGLPHLQFPRLTPGVKAMMIACAVMQVLQFLTAGGLTPWLGIGLSSFDNLSVLGVVNLLTYQFVHSYRDLFHILMNMLVLYFFGTMVEEGIGTRRFVRLYLLAGVVGGVFWLAFASLTGNRLPCVGASGACFGVMTFAAFMNPNARVIFIIVFVRLWWLAAIFGLIALYRTVLALRHDATGGGVADAAHLGGMVFAAFWYRYASLFGGLGQRLEAWANARERRRAGERQVELDRILAKISDVGMNGLTSAERRFLKRYSKDRRK